MADGSKIEWTDATWNPVTGRSVVSAGCTNCYAMKLAGGRLRHHPSRAGLTRPSRAGPVWTGEVRLNEAWLDQPLKWSRPRTIFVCAHGDLFHENVPDAWIDRVFTVMALAPQHRFQVLTKRAERMRDYLTRLDEEPVADTVGRLVAAWPGRTPTPPEITFPLPNVWLGVSVEDQRAAEQRVRHLTATPAAVRFLSCEPLIGAVDLRNIEVPRRYGSGLLDAFTLNFKTHQQEVFAGPPSGHGPINWVIVGGESGPRSRPMLSDWALALRDQCAAVGVPFFFKQWGDWLPAEPWYPSHPVSLPLRAWGPNGWTDHGAILACSPGYMARIGKAAAGRLLDGIEHNGMPSRP